MGFFVLYSLVDLFSMNAQFPWCFDPDLDLPARYSQNRDGYRVTYVDRLSQLSAQDQHDSSDGRIVTGREMRPSIPTSTGVVRCFIENCRTSDRCDAERSADDQADHQPFLMLCH